MEAEGFLVKLGFFLLMTPGIYSEWLMFAPLKLCRCRGHTGPS